MINCSNKKQINCNHELGTEAWRNRQSIMRKVNQTEPFSDGTKQAL